MAIRTFGTMADGTAVHAATLCAGELSLDVIGLGAVIRDLTLTTPTGPLPLVLGLETLADYLAHSPSMGIVAGRFANRIAGGRFTLDGETYQLPLNERGRTHLHGGGKTGFGNRVWTVIDDSDTSVTFRLLSADRDQGYPGNLETTVSYSLQEDRQVTIELVAVTDAPTIINLATHSYFNLDGGGDILGHRLEIPAFAYLPIDADLIPTGEIAPVAGTPFDFRRARPVDYRIDGTVFGYDHNFCVDRVRAAHPRQMARLTGGVSGVTLDVRSTEPGVQLYDGAGLNVPVIGTHGRHFGPRAGLCLEPQIYPDTPNQPEFGSAVLRPGEVYRQITQYRINHA
jgi:aldose 1-epimerase